MNLRNTAKELQSESHPALIISVTCPGGGSIWVRFIPTLGFLWPVFSFIVERRICHNISLNKSPPVISLLLNPSLSVVTSLVQILLCHGGYELRVIKPFLLAIHHTVLFISTPPCHGKPFPLAAVGKFFDSVHAQLCSSDVSHSLGYHRVLFAPPGHGK